MDSMRHDNNKQRQQLYLPLDCIVENVFPFLDRKTWNSFIVTSKTIYTLVKKNNNNTGRHNNLSPPWPQTRLPLYNFDPSFASFSCDGKVLVCVKSQYSLQDQEEEEDEQQRQQQEQRIMNIDGENETLISWDRCHGRNINTKRLIDIVSDEIDFSPTDPNLLLLASHNGPIRLWNYQTESITTLVHPNQNRFKQFGYVSFSNDGTKFATAARNFDSRVFLQLWDFPSAKLCQQFHISIFWPMLIDYTQDYVICMETTRRVGVWNVVDNTYKIIVGQEFHELELDVHYDRTDTTIERLTCIASPPSDQNLVALGYTNGVIQIYNVANQVCLYQWKSPHGSINDVIFDQSDATILVTMVDNSKLEVWNTMSQSLLQFIPNAHQDSTDEFVLLAICPTNSGRTLASIGRKSIRLWDLPFQNVVK